jgi:hypothetical protein
MTTTTAPPQHMLALRRANEIRAARVAVKREIRSFDSAAESRLRAAEILLRPPDAIGRMSVLDFLCWPRRTRAYAAHRILLAAQVSETRPVGDLTDRERRSLAQALGLARPERPRDQQPRSTPTAAETVAILTDAGLASGEIHDWWRRRRHDLRMRSPREAIAVDPQTVLGLAEQDADRFRGEGGR